MFLLIGPYSVNCAKKLRPSTPSHPVPFRGVTWFGQIGADVATIRHRVAAVVTLLARLAKLPLRALTNATIYATIPRPTFGAAELVFHAAPVPDTGRERFCGAFVSW